MLGVTIVHPAAGFCMDGRKRPRRAGSPSTEQGLGPFLVPLLIEVNLWQRLKGWERCWLAGSTVLPLISQQQKKASLVL